MKTTNDKHFKLTLVTPVAGRPDFEETETIQAFDMAHAHRVAAKMFPDVSRLGSIRVKEMPEMPEMVSIDKAFGDFTKACDKAIGKCQDFIDMDVTGKVDTSKVDDCDVKGIDHADHPDYSDAYIASAKYDDPVTGEYRDLTEEELDSLPSDFVQEKVEGWIH